jgi:hypothetical protein
MGWSSRASIERTDYMLVYGLSKPSSRLSTEGWLFSIASLTVLGEKLDMDPRIDQPSYCGLCQEPFFSGGSGSIQICWWLHKRLLYVDHMRYIWLMAIRGPSVENMWRIGRVFPFTMYNNLNHHDSRIWVTACLWQSARSNLINLTCFNVIVVIWL